MIEMVQVGASCWPRAACTKFGTLAEFGDGFGVITRAARLIQPAARPKFIAAPHTYMNVVVPPSAALHERSP